MHDTSLALAPIPTDIGPVTSVDALLQEIEAESGNSSAPSRSEPNRPSRRASMLPRRRGRA
jgi:hypothetical protein